MKANGLTNTHRSADRDRLLCQIRTQHVGDQEVTPLEPLAILAHRDAQMKSLASDHAVGIRHAAENFATLLQRRFAPQLIDDVVFRRRDHEMRSHGPAPL